MHATIRRYDGIDQARTDELVKKVSESLAPKLSKLPGFKGYYLIEAGNGTVSSLGLFDTAEQGVSERAKAGNYEIVRYPVPPDEVERWNKVAGEPLWNEWVKKMEGKGHREARTILNTAVELLKN